MIVQIKLNLAKAQNRIKVHADRHRIDRTFLYLFWLKLQQYKQHSVQSRTNQKLSPKFVGLLQIEELIGKLVC